MDKKPVKFLVVDSSAFIRQAPINDLTDTAYSVDGVVGEIKDANTRNSLQVLPYDLKFKQPTSEAVQFIHSFSKKTGDYSSLSAVDIQLLALTYQLCKENFTPEEFKNLRLEPTKKENNVEPVKFKSPKAANIIGFYLPKSKTVEEKAENEGENVSNVEKICESKNEQENKTEEDEPNETEEDENDTDGWICPSNLNEIKSKENLDMEAINSESSDIKVACMTSDFSMQNVLIQIGIPVLSVDGLIIRKARSYVLKCITCKKITTNLEKVFCPICGYKTLERIIMVVDSDGNKSYFERKKPLNLKGLRFSLPTPHGGKHPNYPILSEDQPRAQNYPTKKAKQKNNPLDPDYIYQNSPFLTRDVHSRAANLGVQNRNSRRF